MPRSRLSLAKPPTVAKSLTPKVLAGLKWDDPKLLGNTSAKVGSYPMQLRDGDLLLFRDANDAAASTAASSTAADAGRGGRGAAGRGAKRGGSKPWQNAAQNFSAGRQTSIPFEPSSRA